LTLSPLPPSRLLCSTTALALLLAVTPARAQIWPASAEPATRPVYQLARPDYDPIGIRLGTFLLFPAAAESLAYDDNIFASRQRVASDVVSITNVNVAAQSQWAQHRLTGRLFATQELYTERSSNDATLWGGDVSARADIAGDSFLQFDASFIQQPLARGTAEAGEDPKRPLFNTADLTASYIQRFSRWLNRVQFSFRDIAYVSARDAARSGTVYSFRDRFGYDLSPGTSLFAEGAYAQKHWARRGDVRDFDLLTGLLGVSFEIPATLQADFGAGVLVQSYRDSAFDTLVAPTASERLIWNVRPLTSIIASVDRTVFGTETFCDPAAGVCRGASGSLLPGDPSIAPRRDSLEITTAELGAQHELRHDILGEASFRYERDHFDFNGLTDRTYALRANLRYLINRFLEADLDYTYRKRTANLPADRTFNSGPFSENVVTITLKASR
jgi:hypothetical protein